MGGGNSKEIKELKKKVQDTELNHQKELQATKEKHVEEITVLENEKAYETELKLAREDARWSKKEHAWHSSPVTIALFLWLERAWPSLWETKGRGDGSGDAAEAADIKQSSSNDSYPSPGMDLQEVKGSSSYSPTHSSSPSRSFVRRSPGHSRGPSGMSNYSEISVTSRASAASSRSPARDLDTWPAVIPEDSAATVMPVAEATEAESSEESPGIQCAPCFLECMYHERFTRNWKFSERVFEYDEITEQYLGDVHAHLNDWAAGSKWIPGWLLIFACQLLMHAVVSLPLWFAESANGVCVDTTGGQNRGDVAKGSWMVGLLIAVGKRIWWGSNSASDALLAGEAGGFLSFFSIVATAQFWDVSGWTPHHGSPEPICTFILESQSELLLVSWTAVCLLGWATSWDTIISGSVGNSDRVYKSNSRFKQRDTIIALRWNISAATMLNPLVAGYSLITVIFERLDALRRVVWDVPLLGYAVRGLFLLLFCVPMTVLFLVRPNLRWEDMRRHLIKRSFGPADTALMCLVATLLSFVIMCWANNAWGFAGLSTSVIFVAAGGVAGTIGVDRFLWLSWWVVHLLFARTRLEKALASDGFTDHSQAVAVLLAIVYCAGCEVEIDDTVGGLKYFEPLGYGIAVIKAWSTKSLLELREAFSNDRILLHQEAQRWDPKEQNDYDEKKQQQELDEKKEEPELDHPFKKFLNDLSNPQEYCGIKWGSGNMAALLGARDQYGENVLHKVVKSGSVPKVKIILDAADKEDLRTVLLRVQSIEGKSPLHVAMDSLQKLYKPSDSPNNDEVILNLDEGKVAMEQIISLILGAGADPNLRRTGDDDEASLLHTAAQRKWIRIFELLLEAGARADATANIDGRKNITVVDFAATIDTTIYSEIAQSRRKDIKALLEPLLNQDNDKRLSVRPDIFHTAADKEDIVEPLKTLGGRVDCKVNGDYPLHSCFRQSPAHKMNPKHTGEVRNHLAKGLIKGGALVNAENDKGIQQTALHVLCTRCSLEDLPNPRDALERFVGYDQTILLDVKDKQKRTPLYTVVWAGRDGVVGKHQASEVFLQIMKAKMSKEQLLQAVNAKNGPQEETALHLASRWAMASVVELLVQFKATPSATDIYGNTPLHHISFRTNKKDRVNTHYEACMGYLVKKGADVDAANKDDEKTFSQGWQTRGRTPLHIAVTQRTRPLALALLKECNANPNAQDKDGNTPLHLAYKNGYKEIALELLHWRAKRYIKNNKGEFADPTYVEPAGSQ